MLIDLANRTDNDVIGDLLLDAVIITEKKFTLASAPQPRLER